MSINLNGCGPIGRSWIERDMKCTSPSYVREYALVVDHAQGSELWDTDGKRYVDLMAGVAVMNVGHRHPYVVQKVQETVDKFWHICFTDFYYPQAIELSEKIQAIAPIAGPTRVYLSNSGTEAVEAAIKLAMYKTGRQQFIGFTGAFHGRTLGALSFTASKYVQRANFRLGLPVFHIPFPNPYRPLLHTQPGESYGDAVINYVEEVLFQTTCDPRDIAAIMVEPIQGEGGYVIPAPNFFPRLRDLCDRYGIMLIVDEVQSGAGRTGKMWAIEHEGVEPDVVCFAKGIGSGMPIGGIVARERDMIWRRGSHGSTYGGNPVACASALATIEVIQQEGLMERAEEVGGYIMERLRDMQTRHPSMGDVRGRGMMIGVEFVKDRDSKEPAPDVRNSLNQIGFEKGVLLLPCGKCTMRMTPALNIPRPLLDEGLEIFEEALSAAERLHPYTGRFFRLPELAPAPASKPEPAALPVYAD